MTFCPQFYYLVHGYSFGYLITRIAMATASVTCEMEEELVICMGHFAKCLEEGLVICKVNFFLDGECWDCLLRHPAAQATGFAVCPMHARAV